MPRISSKCQEEISLSYFAALASKLNIVVNVNRNDQNGVDATASFSTFTDDGLPFDIDANFQLKSVYSKSNYYFDREGNLVYKLKVKNYNDLVKLTITPRYLAVLLLPENEDDWVDVSLNELTLRQRMYYISLKGRAPSTNDSTVTITIPKENILDCASFLKLFEDLG